VRRLALALALACAAPVPASAQGCDDACALAFRQEHVAARLKAFDLDAYRVAEFSPDLRLVSFAFDRSEGRAATYGGRDLGEATFPAIGGFAWLYRLGPDLVGDVVQIRQMLDAVAASDRDRYYVTPDIFLDVEEGVEFEIETTIRFLIENGELFPEAGLDRVRVVFSGPFWRQQEYGEEALGLIKTRGEGQRQGYVDFSARHVLCMGERGVDLIDADLVAHERQAAEAELVIAMESEVRTRCEAAVQIGPTFIERRRGGEGSLRYGISSASRRPAARNLVMAVAGPDGAREVFVVTTTSSIGSFDMMIVLEQIAALTLEGGEIVWAVGIQDEDQMSGPLILSDGRATSINSIDRPTGALIVFRTAAD
jgi:hypothetical protein